MPGEEAAASADRFLASRRLPERKPERSRLYTTRLRLRSREVRFCLADAPFRIDCGLLSLQLALPQLLFENFNLCFGRLGSGYRAFNSCPRLFFARAKLLIVEHCKDLSGVDAVSLANAHFENPTAGLRRDGRIIAFDSSAESDDSIRAVAAVKDAQNGSPLCPGHDPGDSK